MQIPQHPSMASTNLIGRVRRQLAEIAVTASTEHELSGVGIANALADLFDLELSLVLRNVEPENDVDFWNALAVVETSAFLVGRYSEQAPAHAADVGRHVARIAEQVQRASAAFARLTQAEPQGRRTTH